MRFLTLLLTCVLVAGVRAEDAAEPKVEALLLDFARNVVPDPKVSGQRDAFRLYVRTYFANASGRLEEEMIDQIMTHLERTPGAAKVRLGGASVVDRVIPIDPDLARFAADLHAGYVRLGQVLTQPAANVGFWRKLKWEGRPLFDEAGLARFVAGATPAAVGALDWADFTSAFAAWFADAGVPPDARRALVASVAHYAALAARDFATARRSDDRRRLLRALEGAADTRAEIFAGLGLAPDERPQSVLRAEVPSTEALGRALAAFRATAPGDASAEDWSLRPLSEAESALRSLLAQDCATRTYFERAFDPAYHYFTRTEASGHSEGQFTVVLGRAWSGVSRARVAFVDKIQGISPADVPRQIEALRQITERAGYALVLPVDLGDSNGLSNDVETREAIAALPAYADSRQTFHRFRAESSRPKARAVGASRAFANLRVRPVLPNADPDVRASIRPADPIPQTRSSRPIDVDAVMARTIAGKHGTTAERVRYIDAMEMAEHADLPVDHEFRTLTKTWMNDRSLPIALRYRAATYRIRLTKSPEVLRAFELSELRTLLSNWSQSPRVLGDLRLAIWFLSPHLRGEHQILMSGAFPRTLSEDARRYLVRALTSPPFRDEFVSYLGLERLPLHIDFVRLLVFLEAYVTARADGAAVSAELRRAALAEVRRLWPRYLGVLPPQDDHYVEAFAKILARPDLRLDAAALAEFIDASENQPEVATWRERTWRHFGTVLLSTQGLLTFGIFAAIYENATLTSLGLSAAGIVTSALYKKTMIPRHLATVRLHELAQISATFPGARASVHALVDGVRSCEERLTKVREDAAEPPP